MRLKFLPVVLFVFGISCVSNPNSKNEEAASTPVVASTATLPSDEAPVTAAVSTATANEEPEIEMERERPPRSPADTKPLTFSQILNQTEDGLPEGDATEKMIDEGRQFLSDRHKFGQTGAFLKKCAANIDDPLCAAYRFAKGSNGERGRSARKPKVATKTVQKYLRAEDLDNLKNISFNNLMPAMKKLKTTELKDVSRDIVANPTCVSEDLYVALGSVLEFDFPDDDVVALNNQLLEKSQKCFNTEFTARSTFRLGMFKVWKNHCDEAIPLFDLALSNQSVKNLHPRSTYWREWCKNKKSDGSDPMPVASEFYKNFPESFHALLADDGPTPLAYNLLTSNVDPQVHFRSTTNKDFNAFLDTLDTFVRLGQESIAFSLLENLKPEQYQNEEPEVLLYLAIVCNRVQAGLVKFQIMGKIFDKSPAFKTVNTMKLYYPAWYLDTVVQYKDKVNPYLIMALIRQESAFNAHAHSAAGARGLMQLLPGTARTFGRVKKQELFKPEKNIASGVRFFAHLMERYNNQVPLALAAYNAGPLNVDEWVKRYPTENPLLFIDIIPYRETREYVASILRNWYWYNKLYAETYPTQSDRNDPIARAVSSTSAP